MTPEKCAKCLKPKSAQPGSLTQWIILCTCDRLPTSTPLVGSEAIPHCKACGKPIREQRSGSLTQWIFQRDSCSCQIPGSLSAVPVDEKTIEAIEVEPLDELDIESGKFPLDRYGPLEILGEGSTGTVYLSHDRLLQKRVAVKVLKTLDRDALLAFQNEARTTSKLSHPHIIKVLDFGSTEGGVPFMVMELVGGVSLESYLRKHGKLDLTTATTLFKQLSEALAYAHSMGVLHRDLKPSNILIVKTVNELNAYLIDFGVAKLQTFSQAVTKYNGMVMIGTPAYMSPDQALGREFDERSDLYSLACVMFESLTGHQLFHAETPLEVINLHAKKIPPDVLDYISETSRSAAMAKIVEVCLSKDPEQRYQSARDLERALNAIPSETSQEGSSAQNSNLDSASDIESHSSMLAGKQLYVAAITFLFLAIGGFFLYAIMLSKSETEGFKTESAQKTKKNSTLNALGTVTPDEMSAKRPVQPRTKILSISLINETDAGLEHLSSDYPNLSKLEIVDSKISPAGFRHLRKIPIKILRLENLIITREHMHEISLMPSVVHINFGVQNELDLSAIGELKKLDLKYLKFSDALITQKAIEEISGLEHLNTLGMLHCTGLANIDLSPLSKLKSLWSLDLSSSDITDATIKPVPQMRAGLLIINFTHVTNNIFPVLAKAKYLNEIYLSASNSIDATVVKQFKKETHKRVIINSQSIFKDLEKGLIE